MSIPGSRLGEWTINSPDGTCQIEVGRNNRARAVAPAAGCSRVAILTQEPVRPIAMSLAVEAGLQPDVSIEVRQLPDGDDAKNLTVVGETYEWLNSLGFTRNDQIIGVGGGALTDVAGFVAATYLRGVSVAYVPTTLLGAVDASIGGKTGVNIGGKNLAGVFRHPDRVIIDLAILETLPPHLLREGAAEAVKAGFIGQPAIMEAYEERGIGAPLDDIVPEAVAVKVRTVTADFRESGQRATLNYGHTIGHAIEVAAGIAHGPAVSIGMVAAGRISEKALGFAGAGRQRSILEKIGLPTSAPDVDPSLVATLIGRDKKRDQHGLRMVLLEDFGKPVIQHVADEDVRLGLAEIGVGIS